MTCGRRAVKICTGKKDRSMRRAWRLVNFMVRRRYGGDWALKKQLETWLFASPPSFERAAISAIGSASKMQNWELTGVRGGRLLGFSFNI